MANENLKKNTYILTYTAGKSGGKVNEFFAYDMEEAIGLVKGFYRHIEETGTVTKQTEKEATIKATAADEDNPGKSFNFTYTLRKRKPGSRPTLFL